MSKHDRQAIADYFRNQAEWRWRKAEEYSDDERNARCARGLEELATYVLSLPADDHRIIELATVGVRDGVFMPFAGDQSEDDIARFRFHHADDDCDAFLTRLVRTMRDDAIRFAEQHGELGQVGEDGP